MTIKSFVINTFAKKVKASIVMTSVVCSLQEGTGSKVSREAGELGGVVDRGAHGGRAFNPSVIPLERRWRWSVVQLSGMNYAEDRLDRRAAASALALESASSSSSSGSNIDDALEYDLAKANIVFTKYNYCSSSTSFAIYDYNDAERNVQIHELREAHELAGRAYRDSGRNALASLHFGMAWQFATASNSATAPPDTRIIIWRAVGDYAQMCELAGFPEVGILALLYYRAGGNPNTIAAATDDDHNDDDDDDDDENEDTNNENNNNLKMKPQTTSGCNGYNLDKEVVPCYIAFPIDSPIIDKVIQALSCTTTNSTLSRSPPIDNNNEGNNILPTASEILAKLAQIERLADDAEEVVNVNIVHTFIVNRGILYNVPSILHFWWDDTTTETININNINNDEDDHDVQQYRTLPPVLQLLLLKLLYSSPMGGNCLKLACIAVPYLAVRYPLSSVDGRTLARQYKSHWAYYILVRYLVLGERIKEYRRKAGGGMRHHIPVWDVVFGLLDEYGEEGSSQEYDENGSLKARETYWSILRSMTMKSSSTTTTLPRVMTMVTQHPPLYVVGDSHVLSLSWQTLCIDKQSKTEDERPMICYRTAVPFPATGIKAWHVRSTTLFFTHTNLHTCLHRLPIVVGGIRRTIIISAGEIDCREGIGGSLLQGYYHDCKDAITRTVTDYLTSLTQLAHEYNLQILVMPVAPHAYRSQKNGKSTGRARRRETTHLWNETLRRCLLRPIDDDIVGKSIVYDGIFLLDYFESLQHPDTNSTVGYVLHPSYNADYTHVNSAIIPLVEEAIYKSGCDMTLI